ncbi:MAG TPA: class I SAM-dependent methyltransferase [Chthoniobacterales bacterium]|jgi:hypothetical protein|nr:class I SAM-dependent methyltransferase [Chthoniobacterales bacterium]
MNAARNTFAEKSEGYSGARPHYPRALFEWVVKRCVRRENAWDCATGNGQAAVGLSRHFNRVYATDISEEQISYATSRDNIKYSVQAAEQTGFPDQSMDLVVVAQALHWFDYTKFWPEVARVARQHALFCAWGYDWLSSTPDVDEMLVKPFREIIAPFWAANNKVLWNGYVDAEIAFPFQRVETPHVSLDMHWRLDQLLAYMMTWSAFKHSRSNEGAASAMDKLIARASRLVSPGQRLPVRMPLKMVAGRIKD